MLFSIFVTLSRLARRSAYAARSWSEALLKLSAAAVLVACAFVGAVEPAWAYSNACSFANTGNYNRNYSTPDLGQGGGFGQTTTAGEVYTVTLTITGGATVASLTLTVGGQVATLNNAGNNDFVTLTAAGGETSVNLSLGASSGSGQITATLTCTGVAPTITSVSPAAGVTTGGTSVTITGTNLLNLSSVSFGGTFANSGSVVDDNTVIAITNPHTAGLVDVTVASPAGSATRSNAFTYTSGVPTVTNVSPSVGTTSGGNSVTITGTNFTGATAVTFGGVAVQGFSVDSATSITALTAGHAAGTVDVVVTTPSGSGTGTNAFTYQGAVTVTSVTPNSGPTSGGTNVTITGTNFTGATTAVFGAGLASNFVVVNSTTITATTPVRGGNIGGAVNVSVSSPSGGGTGTNLFTYIASPTVTSVGPNSGPAAGGTSITITGTDFTGATAVTIGGSAAAFSVVNATTITATTPAHAAGVVNISVTTAGGTGTGTNLFTYTAPPTAPTVTAVSPNSGSTAGGTSVTVTGTNFTGATTVTFGGTVATVFTVVNATTITATTPAHAAAAVDVVVTTPSGTGTGTSLFTYGAPAPTVTAVSPNSGTTAGGTSVTVTGTNFTGATALTFGGTAATAFTVVNATTITSTTPAHAAGAVAVAVTTPNGTGIGAGLFTYAAVGAPTFAGVSPSSGPTTGNTNVTITGTNFIGATAVMFGGSAASNIVVVNATTISATTPAHAAGAVDVVVTAPGGQATGTNAFTYVVANADSQKLRQMQIAATKLVAQSSGQAISGAVDSAIADAFADSGELISQNGNALRLNFTAEPKSRVDDAFTALAYAGKPARTPPIPAAKEWQAWLELRGTNWTTNIQTGDLRGNQVNATGGLGRKITPNLVVGFIGGFETFDYTSQLLTGHLKGNGWTVGGYLGWRLTPTMRFDAALARSGLNYNITAGTAFATVPGARWLAAIGLTGTYKYSAWQFEPSARLYMQWEHQQAYIDNLGTAQAERNFSSGRASAGAKASHLMIWSEGSKLSPYVGLYADYYFSSDDGVVVGAPSVSIVSGWSARVTSGLDFSLKDGLRLSVGGELGGIGGDHTMWTVRGRVNQAF